MIICFIVGEKNSRQCGITDYVELLAQELEKLGHQTERYFIKKDCGELKNLPTADLYSFQFAPYAYANNGIPRRILNLLARKLQNKKVHLNFHEIWVGAYPRASWKERGIGWLQKNLILGFMNRCKPELITSSNAAAIDRLKRQDIPVEFLYLFGNIPFSASTKVTASEQTLKIAFFGTPYSDFPYHKLGDFFSNISKACSKKLEIIIMN